MTTTLGLQWRQRRQRWLATLVVPGLALAAPAAATSVERAFAAERRSDEQRSLDVAYRPDLIFKYARVQRGMRVAEWWPADTYYLDGLRSVVGEEGAVFSLDENGSALAEAEGAVAAEPGEPGEASLHAAFLLYDVHALLGDRAALDTIAERILRALRPGGHLIIVDAAAHPKMEPAVAHALGRSHASRVRTLFEQSGFEPAGQGRFLENTLDERTVAVAELASADSADRFVLRFRKPIPRPEPGLPTAW